MKRNTIIVVLIIVTAVVMAVLGILAGIYFGSVHNPTMDPGKADNAAAVTDTTRATDITTTTATEAVATETTISTTVTETTAETTAATTIHKLPSVSSAEIVAVGSEYYGGFNYKLIVTGDFASWSAKGSAHNAGSADETYAFSSNDAVNNPYFASGSTLSDMQITITPYNENGVAGNPYTTVWNPNRIEIEASILNFDKRTGIIRTYGEIVPGFTTAYICEGGAMSKVRTELGDGWHICCTRCCFTRNTTWYELYDDWDGDYYGWVAEKYLLWD